MARAFRKISKGRYQDKATGRFVSAKTVSRSRAAARSYRKRKAEETFIPPAMREAIRKFFEAPFVPEPSPPSPKIIPPSMFPETGIEQFAFNVKDVFAYEGRNPLTQFGTNQSLTFELIERSPVSGDVLKRTAITLNTGTSESEFWANYFKAIRQYYDDEYGDAEGTPGSSKGKSPVTILTAVFPGNV